MCRDSTVIAFGVCLMAACAFGYFQEARAQPANCLGSPADPRIAATYLDNFAGWHSVGKKAWLQATGGSQLIFHLCSVNDGRRYLIAKNDDGNDFNPGKYSRFEWYGKGGLLFYCQQVFDAASAAEAEDFARTPVADPSDANDKGCGASGQFPWSELILLRR
jgi:hypothetical protein